MSVQIQLTATVVLPCHKVLHGHDICSCWCSVFHA